MNGVLFINKPKGWTSRDVVNKVGYIFHTKKVGHTGTLDPLATGVLIVCLGSYTKLVELFTSHQKEYIATMRLGVSTDTLDISGNVICEQNCSVSLEDIERVFREFPREYDQEVPAYSAVKVNGKKLYEYAREGKEVSIPKKKVTIFSLEIISVNGNDITFKTVVSKGTYIRSLIRDLGLSLSVGAIMTDLKRTKQGNICLSQCLCLEDINDQTSLKKIDDLLTYPHYEVSEVDFKKIMNGNMVELNSLEKYLILTYQNKSIALYEQVNRNLYKIVFRDYTL